MHGRVFRGLEARKFLEQQKRDAPTHNTNHNHIKLNVPAYRQAAARPADPAQTNSFVAASADDVEVETVVSVVYQTMSATFTGPIGGYETVTSAPSATEVAQVGAAAVSSSVNSDEAAYASAKNAANTVSSADTTVTSASSAYVYPTRQQRPNATTTSAAGIGGTPIAATRSADATQTYGATVVGGSPLTNTRGASVVGGTPLSATRSADAQISNQDNGMSGGAKAGLAFGIIIALALAGGLFLFCWRRRRNQRAGHEEITDEKAGMRSSFNSFGFGNRGAVEAPSNRLSTSTVGSEKSVRTATTAPRLSLRPVTQFLPMLGGKATNDNDIPQMSEKTSAWERRPKNAENPFNDNAVISEKDAGDGTKSGSHSKNSSWEGSEPPTPKSTKFGTASQVRVSGGSPDVVSNQPPRQPNNVHRVQLDFKPSMEDELELRSGALVRMLHEYDDGWCLCVNMDRSKQGVAPRTCLSKVSQLH